MATYTVEMLCNMALDRLGYPRHIGDIFEGSPAARVMLEVYSQMRDEVMAMGDWPFARRVVALTAVAGQTPPSPWLFEYTYPTDCLRVIQVKPGPLTGGARSQDPQPVLWDIFNDQRPATPVQAILTDQTTAILSYMARVTDPATWNPQFIAVFVAALAKAASQMLSRDLQLTELREQAFEREYAAGVAVDGQSINPASLSSGVGATDTRPQRQQ